MTRLDDPAPFEAAAIPPAVALYLHATIDLGDRAGALAAFADTAAVTDEGETYVGTDAIRGWLTTAASEYTYTTTLRGQRSGDDGRWDVFARLEGDFPGGVADLVFRFTVRDGAITELIIAP
ncbi:hypothetical protein [Microbacterium aurantiacum]|uniref:hypothetical protein n=1 Tax=Microbacterium aurantiacum TaxID=162393 RepID=UPI00338F61F1